MSLFKRAFARGVNDELTRLGIVNWPSKTAADEIADAVGDQMPVDPAAQPEGQPVPAETAANVAMTLIDAANQLVEAAGGQEAMPEAGMEEAKTSAAQDLNTRASQQAESLMYKAAAETKHALGSTIEGGDKGNTMADTTAAETLMEAKNRPVGAYMAGVGNTQAPQGGTVGQELLPAPNAPANTPAGNNSATDASKISSLRDIIRKVAAEGMGSTITGGNHGNTMADATAAETKMEAAQRPENYATGARGQGWGNVPAAAVVGTEQAPANKPGETPAGSNSVTEASKVGSEDPFMALFAKTAHEVGAFLPASFTEEQKIAHVRHMMGLTIPERNEYIGMLAKSAGATDDQAVALATKHASSRYENKYGHGRKDRTRDNLKTAAMPAQLAAALDKANDEIGGTKEEKKEEKKDEKKEEKCEEKCEEKKEGMDLLSRIRSINSGASV